MSHSARSLTITTSTLTAFLRDARDTTFSGERLTSLNAAQQLLSIEITDCVQAARTEGLTWASIGSALGVSRQAAWERYGNPVLSAAD